MKPLILISPAYDKEISKYILNDFYTKAILKSGGVPFIIPYETIEYIDEILVKADGLLFSGGGDIHAKFFGEELHEKAYGIDVLRDEFELELCKKAIERDIPVFCACRGMQLLNVAIGGKIIQHIEGHAEKGNDDLSHEIIVEPNSYFSEIYDCDKFVVNSIHHQAIEVLNDDVEILAKSNEIIEAIKLKNKKFVVGVQYHPERIYDNVESKILFDEFVKACN